MPCINLSNAKDGARTLMGYENSSCATPDPYGVALDLTTKPDPKICCQVTENFSAEELQPDTVGCGGTSGFGTDFKLGQRDFRVGLSGDLGFQNGFDRILAQFMGLDTVPVAVGTGFKHILTFAPLANTHFGTFVYETSKSDVLELKSTFTQNVSLNMDGVRRYVRWDAELIANEVECDSVLAVNNNNDLATLAFTDKELVLPQCTDKFLIKTILDDGTDTALDPILDLFKITSFKLDLETPLETIEEMTGGVCNAPTQSGSRTGMITVGIKEHSTNSKLSYCNWLNQQYYACEISWLGKSLGGGNFEKFTIRVPKMVIKGSPGYNVTDAGINGYELQFQILDSINIIAGFTGNGMEIEINNKRATRYLVP